MSAYGLVGFEITNPTKMAPCMEKETDTIAARGGNYLLRAGTTEVVEGGIGEYPSKAVLEFPRTPAAKAWYPASEYQAILSYRLNSSGGRCSFFEEV